MSKVKKSRNRSIRPRRKVTHPLARQREQKPVSHPRLMARERILTQLPAPPANVGLVGNYLGRIGLAKLVERAAFVAKEFRENSRGISPTPGFRAGQPGWGGTVREGSV